MLGVKPIIHLILFVNLDFNIMRKHIILLAAMIFSVSACDDSAEINEEISLAKSEAASRPFKGTVESLIDPSADPECDCGELETAGVSGSGQLTHMGRVASESIVCINELIFNDEGVRIGTDVAVLCSSIIAANGDQLLLEGEPHIILFDPSCLCVKAELQANITGGTGRFKAATGTVTLKVSLDVTTGIYTEEYDGMISY